MTRLTATQSAVRSAKAYRRDYYALDDAAAQSKLIDDVIAGSGFPTIDWRSGAPQDVVWLHEDGHEPWGAAVVKGSMIVSVLTPGKTHAILRDAKRKYLGGAVLNLEATGDAAVLLRYRSFGVPGVLAVEVMRDGSARFVLTERASAP